MPNSTQLTPRRRARRDEAVRRLVRRLVRSNPALSDPACALAVRRLAQLSLLAERLFERCKAAEADGDPQAFILAAESFRRAAQTASLLEKNLQTATRLIEPPHDLAIEMARRIKDQRAQAGTEVRFGRAEDGDGQN